MNRCIFRHPGAAWPGQYLSRSGLGSGPQPLQSIDPAVEFVNNTRAMVQNLMASSLASVALGKRSHKCGDTEGQKTVGIIPKAIWEPGRRYRIDFSEAAVAVFQGEVIAAPGHSGYTTPHPAYNAAVRQEVEVWLDKNPRIKPRTMTTAQARRLASSIRNSKNPTISSFLKNIRAAL